MPPRSQTFLHERVSSDWSSDDDDTGKNDDGSFEEEEADVTAQTASDPASGEAMPLLQSLQSEFQQSRRVFPSRMLPTSSSSSSLFRVQSRLRLRVRSPPTASLLPVLVLIDTFAVALVVPLLFRYYKAAGVIGAHERELLSSLFSVAQIAGGLLMGIMTDVFAVRRKTLLLLSFGGSAVSYALIAYGNGGGGGGSRGGLFCVVVSRLLVGLVKQTMTVATAMLTHSTSKRGRAEHMGRLTACSTASWIVGPTTGALLFKYVDPRAPAFLACILFLLNTVLAGILLKEDDRVLQPKSTSAKVRQNIAGESEMEESDDSDVDTGRDHCNRTRRKSNEKKSTLSSLAGNFKSCFLASPVVASVVFTQLIFTWVSKATSYSQLGSFYEDMYGLEPHHRGYLQSIQQGLQLIVQSALVGPFLRRSGGERRSVVLCAVLLAVAVFLESIRSLPLFLAVLCPVLSLALSTMKLSLATLLTHVAPAGSVFSVLAVQDVLQNAVSVSVPFYRTALFRFLAKEGGNDHDATAATVAMRGDPDPVAWVVASSLHWVAAAAAMAYLLLITNDERQWEEAERDHHCQDEQQEHQHQQEDEEKKGR